jgi:hypothetical protein
MYWKPLFILFLLVGITIPNLQAQSCNDYIAEDRTIAGLHLVTTVPQTIVIRGNYTYSMQIFSDQKGILARVFSKGGVDFNQGDEIIFIDATGVRKAYRFIEMGELNQEGNTPVFSNVLQLDLATVNWFATSSVNTFFIKNNITNEGRKFTVNANRQNAFRSMAVCFNQTLDPTKIKDQELNNVLPAPGTQAAAKEEGPQMGGSVPRTDPNKDPEVGKLREELATLKAQLRDEIQQERANAEAIKARLQEEVALAREQADQKKNEYAQEVLAARKKADKEMAAAQQEVAAMIKEARAGASSEIEKINLSVSEAKQKAAEEIQQAKLNAAQEVASARENAAAEIKRVKEKLELAKIEYSDEIASARENSLSEIERIRAETAKYDKGGQSPGGIRPGTDGRRSGELQKNGS